MNYVTLVPAYGRDYKSGKAVQQAWDAGDDFQICNAFSPHHGRYISIQEAKAAAAVDGHAVYNIRYKNNTLIKSIRV